MFSFYFLVGLYYDYRSLLYKQVTRFSYKRAVLLQGSPANDANRDRLKKKRSYPQPPNNPVAGQHASRDNDLEVVRQKMIKVLSYIPELVYCIHSRSVSSQ
jgi:hypothetical protein